MPALRQSHAWCPCDSGAISPNLVPYRTGCLGVSGSVGRFLFGRCPLSSILVRIRVSKFYQLILQIVAPSDMSTVSQLNSRVTTRCHGQGPVVAICRKISVTPRPESDLVLPPHWWVLILQSLSQSSRTLHFQADQQKESTGFQIQNSAGGSDAQNLPWDLWVI